MVDYAEFQKSFKGDIVEPTSPDYAAAIARWAANAQRRERYVAFPKDEADVGLALKFATSNAIPLAIKGGGHSPMGASSVEDGLCIDLGRYFHAVRVDAEKKLAYVGGGAVWATVDSAAAKHGLATPGGTVNHTGVAGLTLGGGYGWLSAAHGLVIDNLVQATVVTAAGAVLTASAAENPELFWGLRGGGGNFGVVTEFVLRLHPQRRTVFAGLLIFAPSLLSKISELVDEWWPRAGEKEAVGMVFTRGPAPERNPAIGFFLFYNGTEAEGRANFKRFYDLGPVRADARERPYEEVNSLIYSPPGQNYYMSGTSLRSAMLPHAQQVFDLVIAQSAAYPDPTVDRRPFDIKLVYEYFPLKTVRKVAPDATAFRSRGPQPNIVIVISWPVEGDAEGKEGVPHARGFSRELVKAVESTEERSPGESENDVYGNYVYEMSDMSAKAKRLWGENYPRLQKLKKEYDPDMVFNRWFPIQPAA